MIPISIDANHIDICKPEKVDGRVKDVLKLVSYAIPPVKVETLSAPPMQILLAASNAEIPFLIETFETQLTADPGNVETKRALLTAKRMVAQIEEQIIARKVLAGTNVSVRYVGLKTVGFISAAFLTVSALSILDTQLKDKTGNISTDFQVVGDHVKVGCRQSGTSNVSYTAPNGYRVANAFANVQNPQQLSSSNARVISNDGKTVRAVADIRGRNTDWTGNCQSSGSGQVVLSGSIEKNTDRGFLYKIYDYLL